MQSYFWHVTFLTIDQKYEESWHDQKRQRQKQKQRQCNNFDKMEDSKVTTITNKAGYSQAMFVSLWNLKQFGNIWQYKLFHLAITDGRTWKRWKTSTTWLKTLFMIQNSLFVNQNTLIVNHNIPAWRTWSWVSSRWESTKRNIEPCCHSWHTLESCRRSSLRWGRLAGLGLRQIRLISLSKICRFLIIFIADSYQCRLLILS